MLKKKKKKTVAECLDKLWRGLWLEGETPLAFLWKLGSQMIKRIFIPFADNGSKFLSHFSTRSWYISQRLETEWSIMGRRSRIYHWSTWVTWHLRFANRLVKACGGYKIAGAISQSWKTAKRFAVFQLPSICGEKLGRRCFSSCHQSSVTYCRAGGIVKTAKNGDCIPYLLRTTVSISSIDP